MKVCACGHKAEAHVCIDPGSSWAKPTRIAYRECIRLNMVYKGELLCDCERYRPSDRDLIPDPLTSEMIEHAEQRVRR